jgi:glycosyltransferase involved in cell wall biosynthesis
LLRSLRLCVNSQTPFLKFLLSYNELIEKYGNLGEPIKVGDLEEGIDYQYSPGGVTAMVYPLLKRMQKQGIIQDPIWVSLGSNGPREALVDGIKLYYVQPSEYDLQRYANFKEAIWNDIHRLHPFEIVPEEYEAFIRYNWLSAQVMLRKIKDIDLYFIHDFQQLLTGSLIGPSAPAILQWHIPFRLDYVSPKLKTFIMKNIEGFDSIIVSTRRDLEGLIHAGYRGRAYQIYPYIDKSVWVLPSTSDVEDFRAISKTSEKDAIMLIVARMDMMKGQDVAIKAISRVVRSKPNVKLLLIGNGSFSGSSKGGLAHPKSSLWKHTLQGMVSDLKLENNVIFAGYQPMGFVRAAYSVAEATLVPSRAEGFGLTTIESWMYRKPPIVSSGAGSSELVIDNVNGFTFESGDDVQLSELILKILEKPDESAKMGERGYDATNFSDVDRNIASLSRVFEETLHYFGTAEEASKGTNSLRRSETITSR